MNNRETFRRNLNYYLSSSGKMQKDLAEYVGAKTTTVSGWTRGISYPRADAMEKIAMFFGIPTSRLVGSDDVSDAFEDDPQIRIVSGMMENMTKEQKEQIVAIVRAVVGHQPH